MNLTAMTRKLSASDFAMVKWSALLVGIAIGSYFTAYVAGYELWILILGILLAIKPICTGLKR
jgi:hypothetical protein